MKTAVETFRRGAGAFSVAALVVLLGTGPVGAAYTYVGNVTSYQQNGSSFVFTCGTPKVLVSFFAEDMVRVRMAQFGTFPPNPPWVVQKYDWDPVTVTPSDQGAYYELATARLRVRVQKSPCVISFYTMDNRLISKDHDTYRMAFDSGSFRVDKDVQAGDKFFGFGERFANGANKFGKVIPMVTDDAYHTDTDDHTYLSAPFFCSPMGYGIYFNNPGADSPGLNKRCVFRLGTDAANRWSFESHTGDLDYFFIYGPDLLHVIDRYTELTGRPKLPPLWTFGLGLIVNGFGTDTGRTACDQFRSNDIPADMMGFDDLWKDCNGNFKWFWKDCIESPGDCNWGSSTVVPDLAYMKSIGFKTWVWIVPSILDGPTCGDNQETGIANNWFVKQANGITDYTISPWYGAGYYVDFTQQTATEWYKSLCKDVRTTAYHPDPYKNVSAQPDVFKTDDGEYMPHDARVKVGWYGQQGSFNTGLEFDNLFPMLYNNAVCDSVRERTGRGFTLYRAGFAGSQRSPTIWGGDQESTFTAMRLALNAQISCAYSGISFWNHDIGGCDDARPSDELYQRWVAEYGMFLPQPFINDWRSGGRRPWQYNATVLGTVRRYAKLHYRLIPYIYRYAYDATQTGAPMLRPVSMVYAADAATHSRDYDYLYGEYFLVAPVYTAGATTRQVYLPAGSRWTNYWTEERHAGGQTITFSCPVGTLPLLVKGGAIIPMWPEMSYVLEREPNPITLDIYPEGASSFTLYEDDGVSAAWEGGAYATTRFECAVGTGSVLVRIGARQGGYAGMPAVRYYRLQVHHVDVQPVEVRRGATALTMYTSSGALAAAGEGWWYDTARRTVHVKPSSGVAGAFDIRILTQAAGNATQLVCSAVPGVVAADGVSTATVTAAACDASGVPVPAATGTVSFALASGPGQLLPPTVVGLVNGAATVVYRAGVSSGTAVITAAGAGLAPGTTSVIVVAANQPPVVHLTSPINNSTYTAPATIVLAATATDLDGTIASVRFYGGATLLATDTASPYTATWMNVSSGTYQLYAVATDNRGGTAQSSWVTVTVLAANIPPSVVLTAPAGGASYTAPAAISLAATASDADGTIAGVRFYAGTTLLATDSTSPYEYTWTGVGAGSYALSARAEDDRGGVGVSSAVFVVVNSSGNPPPVVGLTSPVTGSTYTAPATVPLTAVAYDSDGIAAVDFYAGTTLIGGASVSPYTYLWQRVSSGTWQLTARATDGMGAVAVSTTPVSIVVYAPVNRPPSVTLASPVDGSTYTAPAAIPLAATASDPDGTVAMVLFMLDGTQVLQTLTAPPYVYSWDGVGVGTYRLSAKAFDDAGGFSESAVVTVVVGSAPVIGPAPDEEKLAPGEVRVRGGSAGYVNIGAGDTARIRFVSKRAGDVTIVVYTLNGAEIHRGVVVGVHPGLVREHEWRCTDANGSGVASGVYLVRVRGAGIDRTVKLAVVWAGR